MKGRASKVITTSNTNFGLKKILERKEKRSLCFGVFGSEVESPIYRGSGLSFLRGLGVFGELC
jgi:hypothetical protein